MAATDAEIRAKAKSEFDKRTAGRSTKAPCGDVKRLSNVEKMKLGAAIA
jgi:hypothetical protein